MRTVISIFVLTIFAVSKINCGKDLDFHYKKTVELNDTANDLYTYDLKKVEKVNETSFVIAAEVNQLQDLDDTWMVTIEVFHNAEMKEEFKKPFMKFPKTGVCEFLKTTYKQRFYEKLKEYANAPDPDVCPVVKEKYVVNDYIFNAEKYMGMAVVGLWRIDIFISKDDVTLKGVQIFGEVIEKK